MGGGWGGLSGAVDVVSILPEGLLHLVWSREVFYRRCFCCRPRERGGKEGGKEERDEKE